MGVIFITFQGRFCNSTNIIRIFNDERPHSPISRKEGVEKSYVKNVKNAYIKKSERCRLPSWLVLEQYI